jgi:hypothetical protein
MRIMSTTTSIGSSGTTSYAQQLAEGATLKRSLYGLGQAVQTGNLTSAGSILTALEKAHPEYATSSSSDSSGSSDSINSGFTALKKAISENDTSAAKTAWSQLKTVLAEAGLTNISSGSQLAAQSQANLQASMNQTLVSTLLGGDSSSSSASSVSALLGLDSSSSSSSSTDSVDSLISKWLTYKSDSSTTTASKDSASGTTLDTAA